MFAKQSYRANSRPKSRQKWLKPWLGKTENASASAARSTSAARDGFGWPARRVILCIRYPILRIRILISRRRRWVLASRLRTRSEERRVGKEGTGRWLPE